MTVPVHQIEADITLSVPAAIDLLQRQRVVASVFGWDDEVTRIDAMIADLSA